MIKCIKKQITIDFEGGNDETAILLTFNMANVDISERRTVMEELLLSKIMPVINNNQQFVDVELKIDNVELIASIENMANDLGVLPEKLI